VANVIIFSVIQPVIKIDHCIEIVSNVSNVSKGERESEKNKREKKNLCCEKIFPINMISLYSNIQQNL
jgi:hypothetical protein